MLLKSGHSTLGAEHINISQNQTPTHTNSIVSSSNLSTISTTTTTTNSIHSNHIISEDISKYLDLIQDTLKEGWTAHTTKDGRLYYCK